MLPEEDRRKAGGITKEFKGSDGIVVVVVVVLVVLAVVVVVDVEAVALVVLEMEIGGERALEFVLLSIDE